MTTIGGRVLSAPAQDYLETIYNITVEGDAVVSARLAEKFGISPASVSEMLQRLQRDGYLILDRAQGPRLTAEGAAAAERSLRKHRLAERFLFEILGMDWITAHEEAHDFQHAMSSAIEARLVAVLGNPTTCPHGNPIPGSAPNTLDFLRAHQAHRLSDAPEQTHLTVLCISEVVEDETALLRYLGEKGIKPKAHIIIQDAGPGKAGPLTLVLANQTVALERAVADKVWVYRSAESTPLRASSTMQSPPHLLIQAQAQEKRILISP